jgi:hypothetical protein
MIKNKRGLLFSILPTIIVAIVYSLIVFLVVDAENRNNIFWMSYAFTMAAIIFNILCAVIVIGKGGYPKKTFLGLSVLHAGMVYMFVQLIAGILLMLLPDGSWKLSLIVQVIILAIFLIAVIGALAVGEHTTDFEAEVAQKRYYIQSIVVELEGMAAAAQDAAVKKLLKDLYESFKYSDPMSNDALTPLENKIAALVAELGELVQVGDAPAISAKAKEIETALAERNRKVKLLK